MIILNEHIHEEILPFIMNMLAFMYPRGIIQFVLNSFVFLFCFVLFCFLSRSIIYFTVVINEGPQERPVVFK